MNTLAEELLNAINTERLQARLFEMVRIPSPTGNARAMAEHYARLLGDIGLASRLHPLEGRPDSPSVVAEWKGDGSGPTLQYAGHMDAIHTPHAAPYIEGGRVYGRGSADMKSGLAAITETMQILIDHKVKLPGSILVTSYDLHEHPWGHGEGVRTLIKEGIVGDAVFVTEGPNDELAIAGKGTTTFDIEIRSPAGSPHELQTGPELTNPFYVATELARRLIDFGEDLKKQEIPLLGTETIFLSQIHGGDFFNRLPGSFVIGGTRRFAPDRGLDAVQAELQGMADDVVAGTELTASVTLGPMREGFRQPADSKAIQAVCRAYQMLTGKEMPLTGQLFGADNEYFVNDAGIPAICMGAGLGHAHADVEFVEIEDVVGLVREMLLATLIYFEVV